MKVVLDLLPDSSRMSADMAAQFLAERPGHIPDFLDACDSGAGKLPMRSSRVIYILGKNQPHLIRPYLHRVLGITSSSPDESVVRNFLCFFEDFLDDLSEEEREVLMNLAFSKLEGRYTSIVIRPISLRLLSKLSFHYPELQAEVYALAADMAEEPHPSSRSVAKKILARLRKEI